MDFLRTLLRSPAATQRYDTTCSTPRQVAGQPIATLTDQQLNCVTSPAAGQQATRSPSITNRHYDHVTAYVLIAIGGMALVAAVVLLPASIWRRQNSRHKRHRGNSISCSSMRYGILPTEV